MLLISFVAVTNKHKLSDLKQHKYLVLLNYGGQKLEMSLTEPKLRCWQDWFLLELLENPFPYLSQLLKTPCVPRVRSPFHITSLLFPL